MNNRFNNPKKLTYSNRIRCGLCGVFTTRKNSLVPSKCLREVGPTIAHRICYTCWFVGKHDAEAFASESGRHDCPGCVKKLPYNKIN